MAIGVCQKLADWQIGRARNSKIQTVCVKKALIGRPAELALAMGICPKPVDWKIGRARNSKIQTSSSVLELVVTTPIFENTNLHYDSSNLLQEQIWLL